MKKNFMNTIKGKAASKRVMKRAWAIKKEDALNIWGECLKMAWEEEKAGKLVRSKANTKTVMVPEVIDVTALSQLEQFGRKTLIEIMKAAHVKGWYRIYDKPTMAARIREVYTA